MVSPHYGTPSIRLVTRPAECILEIADDKSLTSNGVSRMPIHGEAGPNEEPGFLRLPCEAHTLPVTPTATGLGLKDGRGLSNIVYTSKKHERLTGKLLAPTAVSRKQIPHVSRNPFIPESGRGSRGIAQVDIEGQPDGAILWVGLCPERTGLPRQIDDFACRRISLNYEPTHLARLSYLPSLVNNVPRHPDTTHTAWGGFLQNQSRSWPRNTPTSLAHPRAHRGHARKPCSISRSRPRGPKSISVGRRPNAQQRARTPASHQKPARPRKRYLPL